MTSFNIDGDNNSPQTITNGNEALFVGGAGITTTASATDTITITAASGEADFLASGALTCGAATQGRMQVHTTPLQYCDNAATPTLRYSAFGDSGGAALTGDSATSFFSTGTLEDARLSANVVLENQANTWSTGLQDLGSAQLLLPNATSNPATCTVGQIHMDNNETPAGQQVYVCSATNTWSKIGDGGGGGSAATIPFPLVNWNTVPDATGQTFPENRAVKGTNDLIKELVFVMNDPDTVSDSGFYGSIGPTPSNCTASESVRIVWTSTVTSGNAHWTFNYRAVAADESSDFSSWQTSTSITDAAPGTTDLQQVSTTALTGTDFAGGDTIYFYLARTDSSGTDTLAGAVTILRADFLCTEE